MKRVSGIQNYNPEIFDLHAGYEKEKHCFISFKTTNLNFVTV